MENGTLAHNRKNQTGYSLVLIHIAGSHLLLVFLSHLIRPAEGRSCPTDLAIAVLPANTNAMITNRMRFDDDDTSRKAELADKS